MEILLLPIRYGEEDCHHYRREHFEIFGVQFQPDDELIYNIINYAAEQHARELNGKVTRNAGDYGLAYYDGGKAYYYRAAPHIYIGEALILRKQRTRESDKGVGYHKAYYLVKADVYALRAAHIGVVARGAYAAAYFRAEEPIEQAYYHCEEAEHYQYRPARFELGYYNVAAARVHHRVGLSHYFEVYRPEYKLGEYARKYGGYAQKGVEYARNEPRERARNQRHDYRRPRVYARRHKYGAHRAARAYRAVDGEVGKVEHLISYEHAYRHQTPDEAERYSAR